MKTPTLADPAANSASNDLSSLLRERLRSAQRRNPRFSLRAFARQLGMDHSTLSQVLRSKRSLSPRDMRMVGRRLGLSRDVVQAYAANCRRSRRPAPAQKKPRRLTVDLDVFQLLSVWHHLAILELLHVRGFQPDTRWIAKALGISIAEVNMALQRLLRLRLLEMARRDQWTDKSGDAEFDTAALTETASVQMYREIHELAIQASERSSSRQRVHGQMVLALDSSKLGRLRALTQEFMNEVRALSAGGKTKDDVYQVEISLFPITTLSPNQGDQNG